MEKLDVYSFLAFVGGTLLGINMIQLIFLPTGLIFCLRNFKSILLLVRRFGRYNCNKYARGLFN